MTNEAVQAWPASASLRVHVAGGSLGGLMAGLKLRSAGCDVTIGERSDRVMDDRGAGIVMQAEPVKMSSRRCVSGRPAQLALGRQLETYGRQLGDNSQFGSFASSIPPKDGNGENASGVDDRQVKPVPSINKRL